MMHTEAKKNSCIGGGGGGAKKWRASTAKKWNGLRLYRIHT